MKPRRRKIILLLLVCTLAIGYRWLGIAQLLTLESLRSNHSALLALGEEHPIGIAVIFCLLYIATTAVSLPGATILTLAGGAIFGLLEGTVLVSFSSTIGATIAFLASRFLFRDLIESRFGTKIAGINRGIEREGAFYLLTLRLMPIFPFFLVNLAMGLTSIPAFTFFWVSQVGMLLGTMAYINAGTQLAQITTLSGILSPMLLMSFALLGILPIAAKWIIESVRARKFLRRFKRPSRCEFNVVVIGAGAAGLVTAYIAAAVKAKVALIEKDEMGGDCLNRGCVPSKAFLRSAKIAKYFQRAGEFGLSAGSPKVDFQAVMKRVRDVIERIEPHDSVARYTDLGVECIAGAAMITSPYEVEVNGRRLTTRNIVVATGASPYIPSIPGLHEVSPLTSDTVWNLRDLPKRLVVLGGGPVGCELAQAFARFGSQVTIVEMAPRILLREDEDASRLITDTFKLEGIRILGDHRCLRVESSQGKTLICQSGNREIALPFDEILVAVGRRANVKGFGLDEMSIEITDSARGQTIAANDYLQTTNYPSIYVCGDVTGPFQFTHTASHQAWYAAVNSLFSPFKKFKIDYRVIPKCTFTDPEVASVGLNELAAKEKGIQYQLSQYNISDLDRAICDGEAHGFVKVLTVPGSAKILGVTIVAHRAGDIIGEYVTAMKFGIGLDKILSTIHIYPTFSEANKFAAGIWKKQTAPKRALRYLEMYHQWRRS